MRAADCIARVAAAAGRKLSDDEIAGIYERVHRAALDLKAGRKSLAELTLGGKLGAEVKAAGNEADTFVQQAAARAAEDLQAEAELRLRRANLQAIRLGSAMDTWQNIQSSKVGPMDAAKLLITRDYSGRANVESIEQRAAGYRAEFLRSLGSTWEALGKDFAGFFHDQTKVRSLLRELRGEDSGDALAKKGAAAFAETAERARVTFNSLGGDIGRLDDWAYPQHHSQERVATAGRDSWIDFVLPRLDRSRYVDEFGNQMSEAGLRVFLGKAWENIATNGYASIQPGKFDGNGSVANRHSESRQIHFKDADSNIEYWNSFGEKTTLEILHDHIDYMARDIAFIEKFGPNPDLTYRTVRDAAAKQAALASPTDTGKVTAQSTKLDSLWNYVSGRIKPSANVRFSGIADAIANLNVAGKLGGAALASFFGDKPIYEAVGHLNNLPAIQRWRNELMLLSPTSAKDRALLRQQGLMLESVRSGLHRFYEGLGQTSTTGKIANAVMRITGMQAINDFRKGAFATTLMHAIGNQLKRGVTFDRLSDTDIRALQHLGIDEADWKVWQLAELDNFGHGNTSMLTPDSIARIPDSKIADAMQAQTQKRQEQLGVHIAELLDRNVAERQRLDQKLQGIAMAEAKSAERLNKYITSKEEGVRRAAELIKARHDLMRAKLERAEAQSDIEAYLLQKRVRNETADFAIDMLIGRDLERTVTGADKRADRFSRQRGGIGERLGEKRGNAERRIVENDEKFRRLYREADASIKAKYEELSAKVDERVDDVASWLDKSDKRIKRRDAVVDRLLKEFSGVETQTVADAKRNAIVKLLGAVNTESEFALVTPGWSERASFYADVQRGTVKGEIWRSVLQFKAFPWAYFKRGMDLVANQDTATSKAAMVAYLVTASALAGAMLLQTRDVLSGKDPRAMWKDPESSAKFWGSALIAGGALGIYGDFLGSMGLQRQGVGPLELVSGPTIGPLLEMGIVAPYNMAKAAAQGKDSNAAATVARNLKGFVPGGNIWYARAALDNLIWNRVLESLSPGYLNNIRKRDLREHDQDRWWEPGESTPHRLPEMSEAVK